MTMILTMPAQEVEIANAVYTVPEFLELDLPDTDDIEYELIGGHVVGKPKSSVGGPHGKAISKIDRRLSEYAQPDDGPIRGDVYVGATTTLGRPEGSSYLVPDIAYVVLGRTPETFVGAVPVAPDLVVEVNSPSDTIQKIRDKVYEYLEAGVKVVWSVYPVDKFVFVYRPGETFPIYLTANDELDGSEVLPGFKVALNKIFEQS